MRDDRRGVYANISFLFVFRFSLSLFSSLFKETILNWNISISLGNFFFFSFLSFFLFPLLENRLAFRSERQRRAQELHKSVWTMESRKLANYEKVRRRGIERAPARWSSSFKRFSTPFLLVLSSLSNARDAYLVELRITVASRLPKQYSTHFHFVPTGLLTRRSLLAAVIVIVVALALHYALKCITHVLRVD